MQDDAESRRLDAECAQCRDPNCGLYGCMKRPPATDTFEDADYNIENEEHFLIAHKVRGRPAFDVAIRLQIGSEEGWIIPTSGHRAYPYWHRTLAMFLFAANESCPAMPESWRDHYEITTPAPRSQAGKKSVSIDLDLDLNDLDLGI